MKLKWWIIGTAAMIAGGIFVLKHLVEDKERIVQHIDNDRGKNSSKQVTEIPESEYEEIDFLT